MTYSIYWINPVAMVYTQSDLEKNEQDIYNQSFHSPSESSIVTAGWGATMVVEGYGVRVWRCKRAQVTYLRMSQRNDAQGYTQPHARMQLNENRSSAATTGLRIFGQGGNATDPPAV
jgi:hypothetical protein